MKKLTKRIPCAGNITVQEMGDIVSRLEAAIVYGWGIPHMQPKVTQEPAHEKAIQR